MITGAWNATFHNMNSFSFDTLRRRGGSLDEMHGIIESRTIARSELPVVLVGFLCSFVSYVRLNSEEIEIPHSSLT